MASKGLMIAGGLGQGLLQGLQSYNDTKRMRMEEERLANAQRASDLGLLFKSKESGYDMTPDGGLIESDYLKKKRAAELGLLAAQEEAERAKARKLSGLIGGVGAPTKGQIEADKAFGKEYQERIQKGGYSALESDVESLDKVIESLKKSDTISGPMVSAVPGWIASRALPETQSIPDAIKAIAMKNLKSTFPGAISDDERRELVKTLFNPVLEEKDNLPRVQAMRDRIAETLRQQKEADEFFKRTGSIVGYDPMANAPTEEVEADPEPDVFGPDASLKNPNFVDDGLMAVLMNEFGRGRNPNVQSAVAPMELLSAVAPGGMQTTYSRTAKGLIPSGVTKSASFGNKASAAAARSNVVGQAAGAAKKAAGAAGKAAVKGGGAVLESTMIPKTVRGLLGLLKTASPEKAAGLIEKAVEKGVISKGAAKAFDPFTKTWK